MAGGVPFYLKVPKAVLWSQGLRHMSKMNMRTQGDDGIGTFLWALHPGGTDWSMLPLNWLMVGWRMGEKKRTRGQAACSGAGSYTKATPCTTARCVGEECRLSAELQRLRSGVSHTGDCEEYEGLYLSVYGVRPLCLRFPPGHKKRSKCCLVIKGRTILAASCIVWWVLCLRNVGVILWSLPCSGFPETSTLEEATRNFQAAGGLTSVEGTFPQRKIIKRKR